MKTLLLTILLLPVFALAQSPTKADADKTSQTLVNTKETNQEDKTAAESEAPAIDATSQKPNFPAMGGTAKSKVSCVNGSDKRDISIVSSEDGSTGVVYNKNGEEKTVAVAKSDPSYADRVAEKIKTNLEASGFTCEASAAEAE